MKYKVMLWYPIADSGFYKVIEDVKEITITDNTYSFFNNDDVLIFNAQITNVVYIERIDD